MIGIIVSWYFLSTYLQVIRQGGEQPGFLGFAYTRVFLNREYGIQLGAKLGPFMGITHILFFQCLVFPMNLSEHFGYW